jgi:hypothetical protein
MGEKPRQTTGHDRNSVIADMDNNKAKKWWILTDTMSIMNAQALDRIRALQALGKQGSDIDKALDLVLRINADLASLAAIMRRIDSEDSQA